MAELAVKQLTKGFGNKCVLEDLTFSIDKGEFVSILGPSGSGKSTLFHLIGGLLQPDAGEISINKQQINGMTGQIGYMPQNPSLFPWRTVLDNVVLGQELHGKPNLALAMEMINKAGLSEMETTYPDELSGGMKQRVAFIRALLSPQQLLCLDEPFSALDEFTRQDMQNWLLTVWQAYRKSILFITHSIDEALYLSDRIIVLSTNPARIKAIFQPSFPHPRQQRLLLSDEFLSWKRKVTKAVRQA
ncbi:ABC-type nitrate/sulfonate/bicarbonate transport system, ATPase component [Amphibacillus marinus]|uniref:ABC-type nitrate/sulfonate/bicarbonate transport system, ATPase component n=1 Tax=Amphibacillus marinus TaxID=872970 RepID=A0A1H8IPQ7_9BACI|nr:ABC transporter ATP-binding protein [Amphibacillus marinus]SEN69977.1 ABC-type nitrate/sulfonate/bicarbonate transport system, ATPase component [Amphibacillus marinus]